MPRKKAKILHVIPHEDCWAIRVEDNVRVISTHPTQREAIKIARRLARREQGELVIHRRDGRVRDRDSYRSDPIPPRSPRQVLFPKMVSKARARAIRKAVREVIRKAKGNSATVTPKG